MYIYSKGSCLTASVALSAHSENIERNIETEVNTSHPVIDHIYSKVCRISANCIHKNGTHCMRMSCCGNVASGWDAIKAYYQETTWRLNMFIYKKSCVSYSSSTLKRNLLNYNLYEYNVHRSNLVILQKTHSWRYGTCLRIRLRANCHGYDRIVPCPNICQSSMSRSFVNQRGGY